MLNIWSAFEYFDQHLHVLQFSSSARKAAGVERQDRGQLLLYNDIFYLDR